MNDLSPAAPEAGQKSPKQLSEKMIVGLVAAIAAYRSNKSPFSEMPFYPVILRISDNLSLC